MKKLITLVFIIVCYRTYAQTQANKDLNDVIYDVPFFSKISSDWRNTTLNKINKFDWTNSSTTNRTFSSFNNPVTIFGTNYYGADPVELPFYRTTSPNVNNPNLLPYAINPFIPQNLDIHPEDGWEMLEMDFGGRQVASNQLALGNEVKLYPYLIIYNRYTSKVRVYYLVPQVEQFNGAFITATFPTDGAGTPRDNFRFDFSKRTAIFSFAHPITNHLDEWDNKAYFTATNSYKPNKDILQWLYGEFDLAYDPCTCLLKNMNNINAKILFQLYTTTLSDIALEGESTTIHDITKGTTPGISNTSVPKTSFMDDINGAVGSGQQFYNEWSGYEKSAADILNTGYDLWSKKLEQDFFKYYSGGVSDPKTGLPINNLADLKTSGLWNEWLKIEKSNSAELNLLKGLKNVASYVPYVGAAIGVVDYMVNGAKKNDQTVAAPSVSQTRYKFTGTLTYTSAPNTVTLNLPGARNQNFVTIDNNNNNNGRLENGTYLENTENAIYNHTLGVFNLLGPPKFESIDLNKSSRLVKINEAGVGKFVASDLTQKPINFFSVQQCKITDIPKYVVNPAADVEVVSIDAAIVLEFESNSDGYNLFMDKYSEWNKFATIPFHKDYYKNGSAITLEDRIKSIAESGLELDYVSNSYPSISNKAVIRFRTAYVPYNCLTMPNFTIFNWNKGMKVYLKLMVRLQRKHTGSSSNFTSFSSENEKIPLNMVLSYDVTTAYNERIDNTWSPKGDVIVNATPFSITSQTGQTISQQELAENTTSVFILGDWRCYTTNISSSAYTNPFFPGGNQTYISGVNKHINIGSITIPSGSIIPNNSMIKAGENIIIEDGVTIGNNSEIIAGKQIIVNTTNEINPKVVLRLENGIWLNDECKNSDVNSLRANDEEILELCNSNKYKQRSGLDKTNLLEQTPSQFKAIPNHNFEMSIYPNPTNNGTQIIFNIVKPTNININVLDISGNKISTIANSNFVDIGSHIEFIDTRNLTSGAYLVTLTTMDGYSETKKLIIAK